MMNQLDIQPKQQIGDDESTRGIKKGSEEDKTPLLDHISK